MDQMLLSGKSSDQEYMFPRTRCEGGLHGTDKNPCCCCGCGRVEPGKDDGGKRVSCHILVPSGAAVCSAMVPFGSAGPVRMIGGNIGPGEVGTVGNTGEGGGAESTAGPRSLGRERGKVGGT